ncbi:hypothetical protein HDU67_006837 [Dinochytrium kinnereticum]|nr:hypothetical protein HDU67_006837 [Dinochytrium kinnereticum]
METGASVVDEEILPSNLLSSSLGVVSAPTAFVTPSVSVRTLGSGRGASVEVRRSRDAPSVMVPSSSSSSQAPGSRMSRESAETSAAGLPGGVEDQGSSRNLRPRAGNSGRLVPSTFGRGRGRTSVTGNRGASSSSALSTPQTLSVGPSSSAPLDFEPSPDSFATPQARPDRHPQASAVSLLEGPSAPQRIVPSPSFTEGTPEGLGLPFGLPGSHGPSDTFPAVLEAQASTSSSSSASSSQLRQTVPATGTRRVTRSVTRHGFTPPSLLSSTPASGRGTGRGRGRGRVTRGRGNDSAGTSASTAQASVSVSPSDLNISSPGGLTGSNGATPTGPSNIANHPATTHPHHHMAHRGAQSPPFTSDDMASAVGGPGTKLSPRRGPYEGKSGGRGRPVRIASVFSEQRGSGGSGEEETLEVQAIRSPRNAVGEDVEEEAEVLDRSGMNKGAVSGWAEGVVSERSGPLLRRERVALDEQEGDGDGDDMEVEEMEMGLSDEESNL